MDLNIIYTENFKREIHQQANDQKTIWQWIWMGKETKKRMFLLAIKYSIKNSVQ